MIYLTCEINKQVYKKAELPLKSENVLKMTYGYIRIFIFIF